MCGCSKRNSQRFRWTSQDGTTTQDYPTEVQARAKVLRQGGSYVVVSPTPAPA